MLITIFICICTEFNSSKVINVYISFNANINFLGNDEYESEVL